MVKILFGKEIMSHILRTYTIEENKKTENNLPNIVIGCLRKNHIWRIHNIKFTELILIY